MLRYLAVSLLILASLAWTVPAHGADATADEAEKAYQETFGLDEARVRRSRAPLEHAAFAAELMKWAVKSADEPQYQIVLLRNAYDVAMAYPEGYAVAIEAMETLAQRQPRLKAEAMEKLLVALEKQYLKVPKSSRGAAAANYLARVDEKCEELIAAGEAAEALTACSRALSITTGGNTVKRRELTAKRQLIQELVQAEKRLVDLKKTLRQTPADSTAATEAARLLVLELDRPTEAVEYLQNADESLRSILSLAAKSATSLEESEALQLGEWYHEQSQAPKASRLLKSTALAKARACYDRYLRLHTQEDVKRLSAERTLSQQIAPALAAQPALLRTQRVIDLLPLIDLKRDVLDGDWQMTPDGLVGAGAEKLVRLRILYRPPQEYDFRVTFTIRRPGDWGDVGQVVPHGGRSVLWLVGAWRNRLGAFTLIDNVNGDKNHTAVPFSLKPSRQYTSVVRVRHNSISAWVDGVKLTQHETNGSDLDVLAGWHPGPGVLGLAAKNDIVFHRVELIERTGQGQAFVPGERELDRAWGDAMLTAKGNNPGDNPWRGDANAKAQGLAIQRYGHVIRYNRLWSRDNVLLLMTGRRGQPSVMDFSAMTTLGPGTLRLMLHNAPRGDCRALVRLNGKEVRNIAVGGDRWIAAEVPFARGDKLFLEQHPTGWNMEHLFFTYEMTFGTE